MNIKTLAFALAASGPIAAPSWAADTFTFDPGHSQIVFGWDHLGMSVQTGKFVGFGGEVVWDDVAVENSSVRVEIAADSLQTGNPEFDGHLRSDEFFDVTVYPDITFESTNIAVTGPDTALITGDLTIRDITQPVELDTTLNFRGSHPSRGTEAAGFHATATVLRSDFGLGAYGPAISDRVELTIAVELAAAE